MKRILLLACLTLAAHPTLAAPKADLWPLWNKQNNANSASIDHSAWQRFLDAHVETHPDGINRVDYAGIAGGPGEILLKSYLRESTALDPRTFNRDEQFADWVNLYNALTIDLVLRYPRKKSIRRMGERFFSIGPWNDPVATIAGESVTLNDIEHRILRPIWRDHRIHFAVNCASLGCPNLSKTAFTAANSEAQLAAAERTYLAHSRGVEITGNNKVRLSTIFKWYRVDFAGTEQELVSAYIGRHRPDVAALAREGRVRVSYEYDWALNGKE